MCLLHSAVHSRMAGFANMVYRKQCFAGVHLAVIQLAILGGDSGHCLTIVLEAAQLFSGEPQQAHCQKAVAAVRLLLWSQVRWISRPTLTKMPPSSSLLSPTPQCCTPFSEREQVGEMHRAAVCSTTVHCLLPLAEL